ncbi:MAG: radical SAM family heme chaperone HemW, partial [Bacteroidetes bacterium]|nr:radical SAM family heme chaperone HemW [Bacteroidota bacterium]
MASLYLHIPFCERKCNYCDFYSVEAPSLMDRFLDALVSEMSLYSSHARGVSMETIYLGGGTPSLMSVPALEKVLGHVRRTFQTTHDCEVTLEVNPGTVSREKLVGYRSLGVSRLSIGVQSFHDDELKFLSRIHSAREAEDAIEVARSAGFDNVSLDLIFALPGQTLERWERGLAHALRFEPEHISAYSLVVEDDTPLDRSVRSGEVIPSSLETEARMLEFTMQYLGAREYDHYEVSNYARQGYRSRHNYSYWSHQNYLGLGPSAHSFWRSPDSPSATRWWNVSDLWDYIQQVERGSHPISSEEAVPKRSLINERIFLGLRSDGLDLRRLKRDFQCDLDVLRRDALRSLLDEGLMCYEGDRIVLT